MRRTSPTERADHPLEGDVAGTASDGAVAVAALSTRERLLAAGRAVIDEHGYGGASVAAIAARAGVANGALYRHFPSKANLFEEVFRDVCGHEIAAMEAALAAAQSPVERVLAPLRVFVTRALANRTLAWALLAEPVDASVEVVRLEYRRTYRRMLEGPLRDAVTAGVIPSQDVDLTAGALVGAAAEVLVGPVSPVADGSADRPRLIEQLDAIARRTIGAGPSRADG